MNAMPKRRPLNINGKFFFVSKNLTKRSIAAIAKRRTKFSAFAVALILPLMDAIAKKDAEARAGSKPKSFFVRENIKIIVAMFMIKTPKWMADAVWPKIASITA
jgi:hypothetical protein